MKDHKEVNKEAMKILGMSLREAEIKVQYLSSLPMRKALGQCFNNQTLTEPLRK